jgi:hypothetical protein
MVSRVVSLFRFHLRCLIRISVTPSALRRLIRPFVALPFSQATPRWTSRTNHTSSGVIAHLFD